MALKQQSQISTNSLTFFTDSEDFTDTTLPGLPAAPGGDFLLGVDRVDIDLVGVDLTGVALDFTGVAFEGVTWLGVTLRSEVTEF